MELITHLNIKFHCITRSHSFPTLFPIEILKSWFDPPLHYPALFYLFLLFRILIQLVYILYSLERAKRYKVIVQKFQILGNSMHLPIVEQVHLNCNYQLIGYWILY